MPFEVLGTSGYEYYHIDDLEDVIKSHQARKYTYFKFFLYKVNLLIFYYIFSYAKR